MSSARAVVSVLARAACLFAVTIATGTCREAPPVAPARAPAASAPLAQSPAPSALASAAPDAAAPQDAGVAIDATELVLALERGEKKDALQAIASLAHFAALGRVSDQHATGALWNATVKAVSDGQFLPWDVMEAFYAAKDPSYGARATALLGEILARGLRRSDRDRRLRELCARTIAAQHHSPGARSVVRSLVMFPAESEVGHAAVVLWEQTEPMLLAALAGTNPELAPRDEEGLAAIFKVLGDISRPGGRDALVAAASRVKTPDGAFALADALEHLPADPRTVAALESVCARVPEPPDGRRNALLSWASRMDTSSLVPWLVQGARSARNPETSMQAWSAAAMLMTRAQAPTVKALEPIVKPAMKQLTHDDTFYDREMKRLEGALASCNEDPDCYVRILDEPIPSEPTIAPFRAMKAATMSAIHGAGARAAFTRAALVSRFGAITNYHVRGSVLAAIDALAPNGDVAAASAIEAVFEAHARARAADASTPTDESRLALDDSILYWSVPIRLRARAAPWRGESQ